jgi:hypothetical protein
MATPSFHPDWLAHNRTVGKVVIGDLYVRNDAMRPCPTGTQGTLWFKSPTPFSYFNDAGDGEIEVAVLIERADIADHAEGAVAGMRLRGPRRFHAVYRTDGTTKADSRSRIA